MRRLLHAVIVAAFVAGLYISPPAVIPASAAITFTVDDCSTAPADETDGSVEVPNSSPANGEGMIAFHFIGEDAFQNRINEGSFPWTEFVHRQDITEGVSDKSVSLFYRFAGGSEPATYTFDATTDATMEPISGNVCNIQGLDTTTPEDVAEQWATDLIDQTGFTTPAITPVTDGAWVCSVLFISGAQNFTAAPTAPMNYTRYVWVPDTGGGNLAWAMACREIATAAEETPGAWSFSQSSTTADPSGVTIALRPLAAAAGEFDVTPSVASQTATAYTITGSLDAAGDVYFVACAKDQTAPTGAQVAAGDCTGDVNALATDMESPSTGDFDFTAVLTLTNDFPIADLYAWDGVTLVTLADEVLDVPAGMIRCVLASVAMSSPLASTDAAAGDYLQLASITDPNAYGTFCETDGSMGYSAGGDESRQFIDGEVYDVSAEAVDLYD